MTANSNQLTGRKLRYTLKGHGDQISRIAWSPDGDLIASGSNDRTIKIWSLGSGNCIETFPSPYSTITNLTWSSDGSLLAASSIYEDVYLMSSRTGMFHGKLTGHTGWVTSMAWSPDGVALATTCADEIVRIWIAANCMALKTLKGHRNLIRCIAWSPKNTFIATASSFGNVRLWDAKTWEHVHLLSGHSNSVNCMTWAPNGTTLVSSSADGTIRIWDVEKRDCVKVLEGLQNNISTLSFSYNGNIFASMDEKGIINIWDCNTWKILESFEERSLGKVRGGLVFNPKKPVFNTISEKKGEIHVYDFAPDETPVSLDVKSIGISKDSYKNVKIILVGDTASTEQHSLVNGVQKVKPEKDYLIISDFYSSDVKHKDGSTEKREIILWDLSSRPEFKDIYQLQMHNISFAVIFFYAAGKKNVLESVRFWNEALCQTQVINDSSAGLKKILMALHPNPKELNSSMPVIKNLADELGFDRYFAARSKNLKEISGAPKEINKMIDWDSFPKGCPVNMFNAVEDFFAELKERGMTLSNVNDLFNTFININKFDIEPEEFKKQFDACIEFVDAKGIIRKLSFGGLILFKPELLYSYILPMISATKEEAEGLGNISEEYARSGRFNIPDAIRIKDTEQEKLFLIAAVEELLYFKIAIRETTDKGQCLIFPLQIKYSGKMDNNPIGKSVSLQFKGAALNIFATLIVNISYSSAFRKKNVCVNGALFTSNKGGDAGILLQRSDGESGEFVLFFNSIAGSETRINFEKSVQDILMRLALPDSLKRSRIFACPKCSEVIEDSLARHRQELGHSSINCPGCDTPIPLVDAQQQVSGKAPHQSFANMGVLRSLDNVQMGVSSHVAVTSTAPGKSKISNMPDIRSGFKLEPIAPENVSKTGFSDWAGSSKCTLGIVFTDIIGSSVLCNTLGNEAYSKVRQSHFMQVRRLLKEYHGYEIKTIGDSVMAAFRTAAEVLDFAISLFKDTGDDRVKIRVGIHVGPVTIEQNDAFGITVNYAARVENMAKGAEIWVSNEAKTHIDQEGMERHSRLLWTVHNDCELKGFKGSYRLWSAAIPKGTAF